MPTFDSFEQNSKPRYSATIAMALIGVHAVQKVSRASLPSIMSMEMATNTDVRPTLAALECTDFSRSKVIQVASRSYA